jgi:phage baseplate assembly protein W
VTNVGNMTTGFQALLRSVDDPRTSRYRGPAIPWFPLPDGHFAPKGTREVIWAAIVNVLLTPIGTRVRNPEFGSRLYELVFELNDDLLVSLARVYIVEALRKWEPRIEITEAEVYRDSVDEHKLTCRLSYSIKSEAVEERHTFRFAPGTVMMERVT